MKTFNIEFHFRYGMDEKDFDTELVEANTFTEAVKKLKQKYDGKIWIFQTKMIPL